MVTRLPAFILLTGLQLLVCACSSGTRIYPVTEAVLIGQTQLVPESPDGAAVAHVTGFNTPGDSVEFTVIAPKAGYYALTLRYQTGSAKRIPVFVNGRLQGSRLFPETEGFADHRFGRVVLDAGENRVRIDTDWGWADLASLSIKPTDTPPPFKLSADPVNPQASPEARALYARLLSEFGRRTFTGQHDATPEQPTRVDQVARLTGGPLPAVLGLDMLRYSHALAQPHGDQVIEQAIAWSRDRGGLVTISWHWMSPDGQGDPVWSSFATSKTTFDVRRVADERSTEYQVVLRDLDRIAEQLARLRDAGVPVLWRPLHEAEGRWFWWGAHGPEPTRHLYRLMFERFTHHHRLDNLLWVWTSTDDDGARDWYPGDDYVDVVVADLYFPSGFHGDLFTHFDELRERYRGRKPLALGECGTLPELSAHAPWLWFLAWDDYIVRDEINPPDHVKQVYGSDRAIVTRP